MVLNGEGQDSTRELMQGFGSAFAAGGHELIVTRSEPGKYNALNVGDASRRPVPVVYLDADVVPLPGLLPRLQAVLAGRSAPTLATPRLFIAHGPSPISRAFGTVWSEMPIVHDGVIGGGCYAVNSAGRALWGPFPEVMGDDAFVCAMFEERDRIALAEAAIYIALPQDRRALIDMRARWLRSTSEGRTAARQLRLATRRPADLPRPGNARWRTLRRPELWRHVAGFAFVDLAARASLRPIPPRPGWRPHRAPEQGRRLPHRPHVHVVIVSYNSEGHLPACLAAITSSWARLSVTVFDNASTDASVRVAQAHQGVRIVRSTAPPR